MKLPIIESQGLRPKGSPQITSPTAKPQTVKLQASNPQTVQAQTGKPQASKPQTGKPQTGKPQTSKTQAAKLTGKPQTAKLQAAQPHTVKLQSGNHQSINPLQRILRNLAEFRLPKPQFAGTKKSPENLNQAANLNLKIGTTTTQPAAEQAATPVAGKDKTGFLFSKHSKGSQLAFHLLLVKPWILVMGFWIFSMLGATFALEGLISPSKLKMALPEPATVTPLTSENAFIKVEPSTEETSAAASIDATNQNDVAAQNPDQNASQSVKPVAANTSDFPAWPLTALVGTCAAGCLVISRRRAMARMAAARSRNRARRATKTKTAPVMASSTSVNSAKTTPTLKSKNASPVNLKSSGQTATVSLAPASAAKPADPRAQKQRRQRDNQKNSQKNGQRKNRPVASGLSPNNSRVLASRSNAQQANLGANLGSRATASSQNAQSKPSKARQIQSKPASAANHPQSIVSVVPASESHALDWTHGSLAHQLDVRRTASM